MHLIFGDLHGVRCTYIGVDVNAYVGAREASPPDNLRRLQAVRDLYRRFEAPAQVTPRTLSHRCLSCMLYPSRVMPVYTRGSEYSHEVFLLFSGVSPCCSSNIAARRVVDILRTRQAVCSCPPQRSRSSKPTWGDRSGGCGSPASRRSLRSKGCQGSRSLDAPKSYYRFPNPLWPIPALIFPYSPATPFLQPRLGCSITFGRSNPKWRGPTITYR